MKYGLEINIQYEEDDLEVDDFTYNQQKEIEDEALAKVGEMLKNGYIAGMDNFSLTFEDSDDIMQDYDFEVTLSKKDE